MRSIQFIFPYDSIGCEGPDQFQAFHESYPPAAKSEKQKKLDEFCRLSYYDRTDTSEVRMGTRSEIVAKA